MFYAHFIYCMLYYTVIYNGAIFNMILQPYFSAKLASNLWSPFPLCMNGFSMKHHFSLKVPIPCSSQDKISNQARGGSRSSKMSLVPQAGLVCLC